MFTSELLFTRTSDTPSGFVSSIKWSFSTDRFAENPTGAEMTSRRTIACSMLLYAVRVLSFDKFTTSR